MAPLPPLTRRGLLAAAAVGALAAGCGSEEALAPGPGDPHGVLKEPTGAPKALVLLVHGGFWLEEYAADLMDPLVDDLIDRGYATWNIEYRRVGNRGGYPQTFEDVAAAYDEIADLDLPADLPVVAVGHSAGGHLAAWAASRTAKTPGGAPKVVPDLTISLSGVLDLTTAAQEDLGGGAAVALMRGYPDEDAAAYALADPVELVPARGRVEAIWATDDGIVPESQSSAYVRINEAAGGTGSLITVPGDHFDLIDPDSEAWAKVLELLP